MQQLSNPPPSPHYQQQAYPQSQQYPQHPQPLAVMAGQQVAQSGFVRAQQMGLLPPQGGPVDPRTLLARGNKLWLTLGYGMLVVVTLFTVGATLGLLAIAALGDWLFRRRLRAKILGSCLRIDRDQLPEIHHAASVIAQRLGMPQLPEIYVLETNTINAITARIGGRKMVFLTDDAVDACLRSGDLRSLNFMLAHELAHVSLGHAGLIRSYLRLILPPLSRVDELSADAVAKAIVMDREIAASALIILLTGPQLLPFVNREAVLRQAQEVAADKATKKAEQSMHHPLLMRRLAHVYAA